MINTIKVAQQAVSNYHTERLVQKLQNESAPRVSEKIDYPETQVEHATQLLREIKQLLKRENNRDKKRALFEMYDKHYKKLLLFGGVVAFAGTGLAGMQALTMMGPEMATAASSAVNQTELSTSDKAVQVAWPVFGALLSGAGLVTLMIRGGYFVDCNGKFQDARRSRDIVLQALVQSREYQKMRELRAINDGWSTLPKEKLKGRHRRKIQREMSGIWKYTRKMEKRDQKIRRKELGDAGREPSNLRRRLNAKRSALKEFKEMNIGQHFSFFADPEGDLQTVNSTQKRLQVQENKVALKNVQRIGKRMTTQFLKRKRNSEHPLEPKSRFQQTIEDMRKEMKTPAFPEQYDKLSVEVQRFLRSQIQPTSILTKDETQFVR